MYRKFFVYTALIFALGCRGQNISQISTNTTEKIIYTDFDSSAIYGEQYYYRDARLVISRLSTDHAFGMDQHLFLYDMLGKQKALVKKKNLSPKLTYQTITGVFIHHKDIYILSNNGFLLKLDFNGRVMNETTLLLPKGFRVFDNAQLFVNDGKFFMLIMHLDASFQDAFCDQNVLQVGVFDFTGNFIYSIPAVYGRDWCGMRCIYRHDVIRYIHTPEYTFVFNIFDPFVTLYDNKGQMTRRDTLPFLPLIKADYFIESATQNAHEHNDLNFVPPVTFGYVDIINDQLYITKSFFKGGAHLIIMDCKQRHVINELAIEGQIIGYLPDSNLLVVVKKAAYHIVHMDYIKVNME